MILDALGTFSDNQSLAGLSGIVQSDNWMDLGEYTARTGLVSAPVAHQPDIAAGNPLYVAFRVTEAFTHADAAAVFRAVVYLDDRDPPDSAGGFAHYSAGTEMTNTLALGFAAKLGLGASFTIPVAAVMAGTNKEAQSNVIVPSKGQGFRFMRVAYVIAGTGNLVTGAITAQLTNQSHDIGPVSPGGTKFIGGIYPPSTVS